LGAAESRTVDITVLERAISKTTSVNSGHFRSEGALDVSAGMGMSPGAPGQTTTEDPADQKREASADRAFAKKHQHPGPLDGGLLGAFDRAKDLGRVDFGALGIEVLVADGDHYYAKRKDPKQGEKPWLELLPQQYKGLIAMSSSTVDPVNPMGMLQDVSFVGDTASIVSSEKLDGTPTVRYRAHMNLSALLKARRDSKASPDVTFLKITSPDADDVPVDLWVDQKGRVVRIWYVASYDETMTYRVRLDPDPNEEQTSTSHSNAMFDLSVSHLDEPVTIEVPSPGQTSPPRKLDADASPSSS
jgi:hypothetical protein